MYKSVDVRSAHIFYQEREREREEEKLLILIISIAFSPFLSRMNGFFSRGSIEEETQEISYCSSIENRKRKLNDKN